MGEALPIKASRKAAEAEILAAEISKRKEQREKVSAIISQLKDIQQTMRTKLAHQETAISHLEGFYQEVDKLAKGKSLLQATDLILEGTNAIIRDAKEIIDRDVYIDRLKEFVPAGENPVYPDILMALRTIQQANERYGPKLRARLEKLPAFINEVETIGAVLDMFIENDGHVATSEDIEGLSSDWFAYSDDEDEDFESDESVPFDFERLDGMDMEEYLADILAALDAKE